MGAAQTTLRRLISLLVNLFGRSSSSSPPPSPHRSPSVGGNWSAEARLHELWTWMETLSLFEIQCDRNLGKWLLGNNYMQTLTQIKCYGLNYDNWSKFQYQSVSCDHTLNDTHPSDLFLWKDLPQIHSHMKLREQIFPGALEPAILSL